MKEKKETNSICKWFKKKAPLSEKTNFDATENGPKKIKPLELSDPIDISSDEKDDLKSKDEEMEVESFADVELDEPVFHKLASPKKLRKRSSSIRSVQKESIEKDESEDEDETDSQPQRRKSSRVRRSVLPEKKDEEEKTEDTSLLPQHPRSRQRSKPTSPRIPKTEKIQKPERKRRKLPKKSKPKADPHRQKSGYLFSSDSFEASDTTEYESDSEPEELPLPIKMETDKKRTPVKRPHVQRPLKKNRGPPPVRTAQKLQAKLDARAERNGMSNGPSGSSQNEESESDLQDEIQLTSSDDEEINEGNFKVIFSKKHPDPLEADLKFDTNRFTKDRSLSEDLLGDHNDEDHEAFLSELIRLTEGRIDIQSMWDYISSRSELNCSLQFTKFYEPINSEQFLVDQTKQNNSEMEQIVNWFKGWRAIVNSRKNQDENSTEPDSQRSCDSMGSDSWQGSQEEESTSKCLFLFGTSGVGKSSLVYACARQFNFTVMEVHAGDNRNGTALREKLKEATQSERIAIKKAAMASFFTKKSVKTSKKSDDSSNEKTDSLILFSGVDLLFNGYDEGFWRELKKLSESSKIPIVFTADNVEANTGLNPEKKIEKKEDEFDFKDKCTELCIHRPAAADAIAFIRMIAYNQGFRLNQSDASNLVNYSSSYRSCLLNLQLWLNSYPAQTSRPLEALLSFTSNINRLGSRESDPAQVETLYQANIPFIALNRWKLLPNNTSPKMSPTANEKTTKNKSNISKIADYLSCFTIFDKEKMIDQEIRTRAKSDCCRGHTDPKPNQIWSNMPHSKDYSKFKSIQSWTESLTLKHASSHIFDEFGIMESEDNLSFDNYYHKTKALSMNGPNDRILEQELEIDGIVSYNSKTHPNWYTQGRKWNCDYLPAIREILRSDPNLKNRPNSISSRRSRAHAPYHQNIIDLEHDEIEKLQSAFDIS